MSENYHYQPEEIKWRIEHLTKTTTLLEKYKDYIQGNGDDFQNAYYPVAHELMILRDLYPDKIWYVEGHGVYSELSKGILFAGTRQECAKYVEGLGLIDCGSQVVVQDSSAGQPTAGSIKFTIDIDDHYSRIYAMTTK